MIKIKASTLGKFLDKISTNGEIENVELNFTEQGIKVSVGNKHSTLMVVGKLGTDAFEKYEAIGKIALRDLTTMSNYLGLFKNNVISIEMQNTLLVLKAKGKTIKTATIDPEFVDTINETPKVEFNNNIPMDKKFIDNILKNITTTKTEHVILEAKRTETDKWLEVTVGETDKIIETQGFETILENGKVEFGNSLINVLKELTSETTNIQLAHDMPLSVLETEKEESMIVKWWIAPIVEPNTEKEEG